LLLSLLLRPALAVPDVFVLTMLAGVALCEAVEQVVSVPVALKWPNDLLLPVGTAQGPSLRKAAGILCEVEPENGRVAWAIVGMGINVNWSPSGEIDGRDLSLTATSLSAAAGHTIDRLALLRALIERLDARYQALTANRQSKLFSDWRGRLAMLGQVVEVRLFDGTIRGIAEDVEPSGALLVRDAGGGLQRVVAGDVL
jgi:BirA family biotin operon repressor/biotin-[acetyl-CoA-carboxylase] ligase